MDNENQEGKKILQSSNRDSINSERSVSQEETLAVSEDIFSSDNESILSLNGIEEERMSDDKSIGTIEIDEIEGSEKYLKSLEKEAVYKKLAKEALEKYDKIQAQQKDSREKVAKRERAENDSDLSQRASAFLNMPIENGELEEPSDHVFLPPLDESFDRFEFLPSILGENEESKEDNISEVRPSSDELWSADILSSDYVTDKKIDTGGKSIPPLDDSSKKDYVNDSNLKQPFEVCPGDLTKPTLDDTNVMSMLLSNDSNTTPKYDVLKDSSTEEIEGGISDEQSIEMTDIKDTADSNEYLDGLGLESKDEELINLERECEQNGETIPGGDTTDSQIQQNNTDNNPTGKRQISNSKNEHSVDQQMLNNTNTNQTITTVAGLRPQAQQELTSIRQEVINIIHKTLNLPKDLKGYTRSPKKIIIARGGGISKDYTNVMKAISPLYSSQNRIKKPLIADYVFREFRNLGYEFFDRNDVEIKADKMKEKISQSLRDFSNILKKIKNSDHTPLLHQDFSSPINSQQTVKKHPSNSRTKRKDKRQKLGRGLGV